MDEQTNELVVSLEDPDVTADRTTSTWFGQSEWFDGIEDGQEDLENINQILAKNQQNTKKPKKVQKAEENMEVDQGKCALN